MILHNVASLLWVCNFDSNINFLQKLEAKSKEQNAWKMGEILGKWLSENCNLAYIAIE